MVRRVVSSAAVASLVVPVLSGLVSAQAAGPVDAAAGVLARLLPNAAEHFVLKVIPADDGRDVFEIESTDGKIVLRGSNGVAICSALNWYLKYYCHASVSWTGDQLTLPNPLPAVEGIVRHSSPHRYRYFFNYCAFSYSFAWWDWPQWERMIDWMALNGINAPLAVTGQEATWQAVYRKLGLTDQQISEFMPGPAYLPFGWMGCLDGWGGPLSQDWIDRHRELQVRILTRERELGMTPILQGFTGHVPKSLSDYLPGVQLQQTSPWAEFPATYFIDPMDPQFQRIGRAFIEEQTSQYGTDHLYASDTFIEMTPPSTDPAYLTRMGSAVYGAMTAADPDAVWFLQGWIFYHNSRFWKPAQAKALFSGVPKDRLILIEMTGASWEKTEAFYGQPWLWALIQDFGGVVSLHGDLGGLLKQLDTARQQDKNHKMCGIGVIMESLGYNAVFDDLLLEMTWRDRPPAIEPWIAEYAHRRYGRKLPSVERAWAALLRGPYSCKDAVSSVACVRPTLEKLNVWTMTSPRRGSAELIEAIDQLLECEQALGQADTYRFDLVNVTRQLLANHSWVVHERMMKAYQDKDRAKFAAAAKEFLELIHDMDGLLATRREFLLGPWLEAAKQWSTNDAERRLYEWNARNQLTLWGPKDSPLHDYAHKQWSGLMQDFYLPRWEQFIERLNRALEDGKDFDAVSWEQDVRSWEEKWTHETTRYPVQPTGDPFAIIRRLRAKGF